MRAGKTGSFFEHLWSRRADPDVRHINNRVPVTAELAYLLGIHIEKQVRAMYVACRCRVHVWDLEPASGNRGEDSHQGALRVAIVDVKCVHLFLLELENQAGQ